MEAFTLDYRVGWPLSIVLSRRAVTKYQLLSRLLYFSKHVERRVLTSWMGHQSTKELNVRAELSSSYCLRHRMLHFLQNFVYYMTLEVISPHSHQLQEAMRYAEDMDQVMELHEQFLDCCLNECLLASQELLNTLTKIMNTCLKFADQMNRFALDEEKENANIRLRREEKPAAGRTLKRQDSNSQMRSSSSNLLIEEVKTTLASKVQHRQARMQAQEEYIRQEASHESFLRILNKFSATFDEQVRVCLRHAAILALTDCLRSSRSSWTSCAPTGTATTASWRTCAYGWTTTASTRASSPRINTPTTAASRSVWQLVKNNTVDVHLIVVM